MRCLTPFAVPEVLTNNLWVITQLPEDGITMTGVYLSKIFTFIL